MTSVDYLSCEMGRLVDEVKPRLRGQLHRVSAPLVAVAAAIQVAFAAGTSAKVACAVFGLGPVLLFTVGR